MKCTTKILIGILLSGVVVVIIGSILLFTVGKSDDSLRFDGKALQVNVTPFRVVNVLVEGEGQMKKDLILINGDLTLSPVVAGQHTLSYPESLEHFLSVETKNDTLNLMFKMSGLHLPAKHEKETLLYLELSQIMLTADSSLAAVRSEARRFTINLMNLKSDSIALSASYLNVDSCNFRSLSVVNTRQLKLNNSRIQSVYLDLDGMGDWNVTGCQLENEYLTGSDNHRNNLQKGECSHMYWKPKNENAELQVTLKEAASVSMTE